MKFLSDLLWIHLLAIFKVLWQGLSRLVLLNKVLEDGNCLYRKGRLEEAEQRYRCGLRKVFVLTHVPLLISWRPSEGIRPHTCTSLDIPKAFKGIRPHTYTPFDILKAFGRYLSSHLHPFREVSRRHSEDIMNAFKRHPCSHLYLCPHPIPPSDEECPI